MSIHFGWHHQPISPASSLSYPFPDAWAGALSPPGREDGLPGRPACDGDTHQPADGGACGDRPCPFANALWYLWCTWSAPGQPSGSRGLSNPMMSGSSTPVVLEPGLLEVTEHYKQLELIHSNVCLVDEAIFWEAFCELIEICSLDLTVGLMACSQAVG